MKHGLKSGKGKLFFEQSPTWLETEFTIDEIKTAVFALPSDKAPGPDGFPLSFFPEFWETIKDEIFLFSEFYQNGKIPKGISTAFLTLIPKKVGASFASEFRPISTIFGPYKILAKVLSNRIKEILHEAIDENQFAFIKDRNIMDCMLIANECGRLSLSIDHLFIIALSLGHFGESCSA